VTVFWVPVIETRSWVPVWGGWRRYCDGTATFFNLKNQNDAELKNAAIHHKLRGTSAYPLQNPVGNELLAGPLKDIRSKTNFLPQQPRRRQCISGPDTPAGEPWLERLGGLGILRFHRSKDITQVISRVSTSAGRAEERNC
jgi:hypothetical protein